MHVMVEAGSPHPTTPEGEKFPFVLLSGDETQAVFADSLNDIVGFVVGPDYHELDDMDEQYIARQNFAVTLVAQLTRVDPARPFPIYPEGLDAALDLGITDEDILSYFATCYSNPDDIASGDILLPNEDHGSTFSRVYFEGLDDDREWDYVFPFVGVATDYLPYTHTPPPKGNVVLVNPQDEKTLMDSLVEVNALLHDHGIPPVVKFFRIED